MPYTRNLYLNSLLKSFSKTADNYKGFLYGDWRAMSIIYCHLSVFNVRVTNLIVYDSLWYGQPNSSFVTFNFFSGTAAINNIWDIYPAFVNAKNNFLSWILQFLFFQLVFFAILILPPCHWSRRSSTLDNDILRTEENPCQIIEELLTILWLPIANNSRKLVDQSRYW